MIRIVFIHHRHHQIESSLQGTSKFILGYYYASEFFSENSNKSSGNVPFSELAANSFHRSIADKIFSNLCGSAEDESQATRQQAVVWQLVNSEISSEPKKPPVAFQFFISNSSSGSGNNGAPRKPTTAKQAGKTAWTLFGGPSSSDTIIWASCDPEAQDGENRFGEEQVLIKAGDLVEEFSQYNSSRTIYDFENHLDDLSKDWRNPNFQKKKKKLIN